jgi:methyl-accepting chemotaxis protein
MMQKKQSIWRLTIRKKLIFTCLILLLAPVAVLGVIVYQVSADETDALINKNLSNSVQMAIELTVSFDEFVKKGAMTEEEAQEKVKQLLLGPKTDGKRSINPNIDLGENGYFFVMNDKGDELAHPSIEGQNILEKQTSNGFYYIKDMIEKGKNGGGFTVYDWPLPGSTKEAPKITYAEMSPVWGWVICAGSYMQDYDSGQTKIFNSIIIILITCWIIGAIILTLFSLHISRPISRLALQAEQFATGDLSKADLKVKNKDEIGDLSNSFEIMYQNLKQLASGLLTSSDSLSAASQQLSIATEETAKASNQIAESIQQVAHTSETQAISVQESSRAMEEMAMGIQRIATTSSTAYEASVTTLQQAEQGNQLITSSTQQMNAVSSTVGDLSEIIQKLDERSKQIGDIVQVITELSTQTNLLALNASIEAARAGEQGRGFAVVASEVKKLAERSNTSAAEVAELVEAVQGDIERAVSTMEKGEQEVEEGVNAIRLTGEAFSHILNATRSVVDQVQEASSAAEQMSASSQEVAASLQEMERMASKSSDMTQSISASTEEQIAAMQEISASADSLSTMSVDMQTLAHRFKL